MGLALGRGGILDPTYPSARLILSPHSDHHTHSLPFQAIKTFLRQKWAKEQDYCLMKELWGFHRNRISARFEYEWHDEEGQWWRSHGNEQWEFDAKGTCCGRAVRGGWGVESECAQFKYSSR